MLSFFGGLYIEVPCISILRRYFGSNCFMFDDDVFVLFAIYAISKYLNAKEKQNFHWHFLGHASCQYIFKNISSCAINNDLPNTSSGHMFNFNVVMILA